MHSEEKRMAKGGNGENGNRSNSSRADENPENQELPAIALPSRTRERRRPPLPVTAPEGLSGQATRAIQQQTDLPTPIPPELQRLRRVGTFTLPYAIGNQLGESINYEHFFRFALLSRGVNASLLDLSNYIQRFTQFRQALGPENHQATPVNQATEDEPPNKRQKVYEHQTTTGREPHGQQPQAATSTIRRDAASNRQDRQGRQPKPSRSQGPFHSSRPSGSKVPQHSASQNLDRQSGFGIRDLAPDPSTGLPAPPGKDADYYYASIRRGDLYPHDPFPEITKGMKKFYMGRPYVEVPKDASEDDSDSDQDEDDEDANDNEEDVDDGKDEADQQEKDGEGDEEETEDEQGREDQEEGGRINPSADRPHNPGRNGIQRSIAANAIQAGNGRRYNERRRRSRAIREASPGPSDSDQPELENDSSYRSARTANSAAQRSIETRTRRETTGEREKREHDELYE